MKKFVFISMLALSCFAVVECVDAGCGSGRGLLAKLFAGRRVARESRQSVAAGDQISYAAQFASDDSSSQYAVTQTQQVQYDTVCSNGQCVIVPRPTVFRVATDPKFMDVKAPSPFSPASPMTATIEDIKQLREILEDIKSRVAKLESRVK